MSSKDSNYEVEYGKNWKEKIILFLVPLLYTVIQRLFAITLKRVDVGLHHKETLMKENRPWIYSVWHTNVMFAPFFNPKPPATLMISASRDGELVSRVVHLQGHDTARGSTTRGGFRALKFFIDLVKKGRVGGITPDGPVGPFWVMQDGLVIAAQRSGAPILPFYYESTNQWVITKSWDRQRIPKPFSTVVCSYGEPIYVPSQMDGEEFEMVSAQVQQALLENVDVCKRKVAELRGHRK